MRVLLIIPLRVGGEDLTFPLGLAYIAAILRKEGHQVDVMDLNCIEDADTALFSKISKTAYDAFGISAMIINFKSVMDIAEKLKTKCTATPIILGGGLATAIPEIVLTDTKVDICVLGEGEITAAELFKAVACKNDLADVKGICFKQNGTIVTTARRDMVPDIDTLPFPAWDLFAMNKYIYRNNPKRASVDIITSRGCPYQCTFCFSGIFGHKFRGRSARNILDEIMVLKKKYNIRSFTFRDDTFVINRKRVMELCALLIAEKLDITWGCNGRINLMDRDMLRRMHDAGCRNISYGIESGNIEMLKMMKKQLPVESAKKVIRITWEEKIIPLGYFMVGLPGETKESIEDSVEFCKETGIIPHFNFFGPLPGTELYDYAVQRGYIDDIKKYILRNDWKTVTINMSSLSYDELIRYGTGIEARIMKYYLSHYPKRMLLIVWNYIKTNGTKMFTNKMLEWVASSPWSPIRLSGESGNE